MAVGSPDGRPGPYHLRIVLRTALLAGFGLLVYLKFDDFVGSHAAQFLRHPGALWDEASTRLWAKVSSEPLALSRPLVSSDSATLEWTCASPKSDSCLAVFAGLGAEEKGLVRAALAKTRLRLKLGDVEGFSLVFRREDSDGSDLDSSAEPGEPHLRFTQAQLRTAQGRFTLVPALDSATGPCLLREDGGALCSETATPRPPLRGFGLPFLATGRPFVAEFPTLGEGAIHDVHAVLPGKITTLPSKAGDWMEVYHGDNLFSYYAGFTALRSGLRAGNLVGSLDTLGTLSTLGGPATALSAAPADSVSVAPHVAPVAGPTIRLRLEKDGAPLDPLAYLGLVSDSGVIHGP